MRADKFLFHRVRLGRRPAQAAIAAGKLSVNGVVVEISTEPIEKFDLVEFDGEVLQDEKPIYIMLHKPQGYVCATKDELSPTVMELIDGVEQELHIVGRLDKYTTGMVLLTNDGKWSRWVSEPRSKQAKTYLVELEVDISDECVAAFREGILFEKEGVVSQPAIVELTGARVMNLTIYEGIHHQIKRMFLKYSNRVVNLHRISVGQLQLDVPEGEWREIQPSEVAEW